MPDLSGIARSTYAAWNSAQTALCAPRAAARRASLPEEDRCAKNTDSQTGDGDDAYAAKAGQLREKGISATDIAKMLGVSRATVYRYLSDGWGARSRRRCNALRDLP